MAIAYRFSQGLRALFAFAQTPDYALASQWLTPPLLTLFQQMRRSEQLHSLRVLRYLLQTGAVDGDLGAAALLHDAGKSCYPMSLWQRSLPVIVKRFWPAQLARWSSGSPENRWLRGFVVYVHHPVWSADLIAAAGGSADAIWLAAHHSDDADRWNDHPLHTALIRLQTADDLN